MPARRNFSVDGSLPKGYTENKNLMHRRQKLKFFLY